MTDAWAEADAASQSNAGQGGQQNRQDAYGKQPSRVFSGGGGGPTLMNRSHPVGTERTGIIITPLYDQQRTKMGTGDLLFWKNGKPSTLAEGGDPKDPVKDTVIELDTEYVMDAAEATALQREEPYEGGERRDFIGKEMKAFMSAVKDARRRGIQLSSDEDFVGKRYTVKRVSTKPNPHGGDPIKVHAFRIDNA